jgi:hypothetical protein
VRLSQPSLVAIVDAPAPTWSDGRISDAAEPAFIAGGGTMRKVVIALGVVLVAVLAVGTAAAKPHGGGGGGGAPVTVPVAGTFTSLGIQAPFSGALVVDRFDVVDNQLLVEGELTAGDGLFEPLAVSVVAVAAPSADPATGACTVRIGMVRTIGLGASAVVELADPTFELGGPGSGQEVCGVLKASDKDPFDQHAIARALNRALGVS